MSAKKFAVHPGVVMEEKVIAGLKEKTGRSLEEWVALMAKSGPKGEKDRAAWLKAEFGLGTITAMFVAGRAARGAVEYDPDGLVDKMFAGKKAALRPIYETLLEAGYALGGDVTATRCSTMVPLRRKYVFAQLKPTTNTRLDLGLALGALPAQGRLIDTGGYEKKDRITHRIGISSLDEIDAEVMDWLRRAYEGTPA
jgi:hypothetical protein